MNTDNFSFAAKMTSPVTASLNIACVAVFAVFAFLKLFTASDWSWWLVTSPLWIGFALDVLIVLGAYVVLTLVEDHSK